MWLVGLCLFLPCVQSCQHVTSPVELLADEPQLTLPLLAPFVLAQPLAIITIVALLRRVPPGRRLGALSTILAWLTLASPLLVAALDRADGLSPWQLRVAVDVAAMVGALALAWPRRDVAGWQRHAQRLTAFALASLPLGMLMLRLGFAHDLRLGGWLAMPALLALPAITLPSLRAITRR
jgi:hypothetical protein